jgi:hypothetical protein
MAIKVTLGEAKTQEVKPFPKLMITTCRNPSDRIVFFLSEKIGIVIQSGSLDNYSVGSYSENWDMNFFTDYNEPITIQNQ